MDKFTVDLEKVLDEFEYNESRDESILAPITTNSLASSNQQKLITPASCYRRPAFEPIHLSDADFGAAPIPSVNVNFSVQASLRETFNSNHKDTVGCTVQKDSFIDNQIDSYVNSKDSFNGNHKEYNVNELSSISQKLLEETSSQLSIDGVSSEGTPDLLDSTSTVRPPYVTDEDEHNQLPDITSVRNTASCVPTNQELPVFDLIKPQRPSSSSHPPEASADSELETPSTFLTIKEPECCVEAEPKPNYLQEVVYSESNDALLSGGSLGNSNFTLEQKNNLEELPPIVEVGSLLNNPLLDLKLQPLTFNTDDISDSELEEYLEHIAELSEEQPLLEDTKSPDEVSSSISQPCSVDEASNLNQITTESTEIDTVDTSTTGSIDSSIEENIPTEDSGVEVEEPKPLLTEVAVAIEALPPEPIVLAEEPPEETATVALPEEVVQVNLAEPQPAFDSTPYDSSLTWTPEPIASPPSDPVDDIVTSSTAENEFNENVEKSIPTENIPVASPQEETISVAVEEPVFETSVAAGPSRPSSLSLNIREGTESEESPTPTNMEGSTAQMNSEIRLGKTPPFWVPDTDSELCMQCQLKFTMIRRRHHCRACGLVLCSKCCCLKAPLEYMEFQEARVCQPCFTIIFRVGEDQRFPGRQPNPNNPMDYCSTIPPLQQAASSLNQPPPSVLVPSGVLKREGRAKSDVPKQVMFSDGIRPGGDLTELDAPSESRILPKRSGRRLASPGGVSRNPAPVIKRPLDPVTQSYIPSTSTDLPPLVMHDNAQLVFLDDILSINETPVKYAVNNNLFVHVKRVKLECCVNRECWSICSDGLAIVGQDEVALVLECLQDELLPPQDVFHFINTLYLEGIKGSTVSEMSYTPSFSGNMLGSKDHGGFLYIRPTFQCTTNLLLPQQPYIIAILVHRWETPWARLFPLRLILRLGAEYRYYPCPLVSIRNRPPLYTDIGHTVMKTLVDFRKYSYSLATVRGLLIHMEDRQTTILFPRNRYDQVIRALNTSNDSVLAFGANLSLTADSHLVCIQGTRDENSYHTQAINIHNKPRKVTGASFLVFNGALKTAGLSGKTSIMEDGLMVQLPSDSMAALRTALRDMKNFTISCGPNDEETVKLRWCADDTNFNVGVKSPIDGKALDGVPSIRVHSGTDYGSNTIIRWTEVFVLKSEDERKARDPLDISKVSESVARATCLALVQDLESLVRAGVRCLGIRANIHPDNVGYEAGSNKVSLPQAHMNRLDNELIPVLNQAATSAQDNLILELVFRIIDHM
ncbi:hypothetical protein GE061_004697 [Apolygus lucorum]|uniref:FYVE-type domain-containing protein n=1 Tax=Apolygus lucorum TaxID=248454 RepID=A0A8S9X1F6_APOLU|nr:hypothetical protein GE061_004697 [Apolygus lucorum]